MTDQAALITGSSRGIGRAIALELARRGFRVAVHGRTDSEDLEAARADCAALSGTAVAVSGDLADLGGHDAILDTAEAGIGPLTTLVSNAGVGALRRVDLLETGQDSFDRCMALNARAPFFLMQAFARRLLGRPRPDDAHYAIISVSSISAVAASPNRIEYCMSKAAAAMMAKTFALRLAPERIQVFDIQPGIIATDMSRAALPAYQARIDDEGLLPMPRIGDPVDVARSCAAAACGDLPYSVGQVLRPDGGLVLERL